MAGNDVRVRYGYRCRIRRRCPPYGSATTLLRSTPIPEISISQVSPGFMSDGTPSVPIHITSPGMMMQYLLTNA